MKAIAVSVEESCRVVQSFATACDTVSVARSAVMMQIEETTAMPSWRERQL
jgi:hypothetical protein